MLPLEVPADVMMTHERLVSESTSIIATSCSWFPIGHGPRFQGWLHSRGDHGEHRWRWSSGQSEVHIWVMGDMLGPYGRDHSRILDWAWQTWPWTRRFGHMLGNASRVVTLIRKHVQCEIDLHRSSCMLLSARAELYHP